MNDQPDKPLDERIAEHKRVLDKQLAETKQPIDWEAVAKGNPKPPRPPAPVEHTIDELAERVLTLGQARAKIDTQIAREAIELERHYHTERASLIAHYAGLQDKVAAEREQSLTDLARSFRDRAARLVELRHQVEQMIGGGQ